MQRSRRAFTIPELLVIVTILAIIVSLLLPAMRTARVQGQRVVCLSNQRSLVVGLQGYATENAGLYPTPYQAGSDWADAYGLRDDFPYTGSTTRNPLGLGLLVSTELMPAASLAEIIHCPTFNNRGSTVAPGHCMDIPHTWGYGGGGWSKFPGHRVIGSYNYRGTSIYWVNGKMIRRGDVGSNFVMMIDTPDLRVRGPKSQFNAHKGYNIVFADGGGIYFSDQDYIVDGFAQTAGGRVDGRGAAANDELLYKRLASER